MIGSIVVVLVWAALGPAFDFSDTWQLWINTGTTILTFNMAFVIQATKNRSDTAVQLKLDELISATRDARNRVIDLEDADDEVVEKLHAEFERVKRR